MRISSQSRKTKETDISLQLNLAGGDIAVSTVIGFFDHRIQAFTVLGVFGIKLYAHVDFQVDCERTSEDSGIVFG